MHPPPVAILYSIDDKSNPRFEIGAAGGQTVQQKCPAKEPLYALHQLYSQLYGLCFT